MEKSGHEARQEVTGASVIEILLLPEMSRDELALVSEQLKQIPCSTPTPPRCLAAPRLEFVPLATWERFVVYHLWELIISGRTPWLGTEGTGKCSTCYVYLVQAIFNSKPVLSSMEDNC